MVIIYIETACYGFLFEKSCCNIGNIWQDEVKNSLVSSGTGPFCLVEEVCGSLCRVILLISIL